MQSTNNHCNEFLTSQLASLLCSMIPTIGSITMELLDGGEEASAVIKFFASCSLVVKITDPYLAAQEVRQLERLNSIIPKSFPTVVHSQVGNGLYVTRFLDGETLEQTLRNSSASSTNESYFHAAKTIINTLKKLHKNTNRKYRSTYHNVIVVHRLETIQNHPQIVNNLSRFSKESIQNYYCEHAENSSNNLCISEKLSQTLKRYLENLPKTEALIHGDPHLGNIIIHNEKIILIDPRVAWDQKINPNEGYFDPLYDIACVAHSVIANLIIQKTNDLLSDVRARLLLAEYSLKMLHSYLGKDSTSSEIIRFTTYLICSLAGNLKYKKWTPNSATFWLTLNFIILLENTLEQYSSTHHTSQ